MGPVIHNRIAKNTEGGR